MTKKRKILLLLLAPILALLLFREPASTTFDLRDGTQLEILRVSYGTKHVAHFGNIPQKLLFKITGPRLSYQWVGRSFVIPSQDSVNGTLGLFVRHRLPPGDPDAHAALHLNIHPVIRPHKDHPMFLGFSGGEYALFELSYWTESHRDFTIENSKNEPVARFQIITNDRGRYVIREVPSTNTQPTWRPRCS